MPTRVINATTTNLSFLVGLEDRGELVSITRPSKWGNPFSHIRGSRAKWFVPTREEAVRKHAEWILYQPELMRALPELRDKYLSCVCAPAPCHGMTLARYADMYPKIRMPASYGLTMELVFNDEGHLIIGAGLIPRPRS